jgi:hypothetical protein
MEMVKRIEAVVRVGLLSGPYTEKDLRRMGHPYARKSLSKRGFKRTRLKGKQQLSEKIRGRNKGSGVAVPLLPINVTTGKLRRSAVILRIAKSDGGQDLRLAYREKYAQHVLNPKGTRAMKARGFQSAKAKIDKRFNKDLERNIKLIILRVAATGRV